MYRLQNHIRRPWLSLLQVRRNLVVWNSLKNSRPPISSAKAPPELEPIHSTIIPHQCYILLHSPQPISEFPAKWNTPVQRALQLRVSRWGGLVNFAWYGLTLDDDVGDGGRAKKQPATVFTAAGGRLEIPDITLENMDQVEEKLKGHLNGPLSKETSDEIHLYVCTHGARDCRCGTKGSLLVNALREEKVNYQQLHPEGLASKIKIGEVSHVGQHQLSDGFYNLVIVLYPFSFLLEIRYAANLLMFPHGEWYVLKTTVVSTS